MAEPNEPSFATPQEYLDDLRKRGRTFRRRNFASMLRGMYTQGKISPDAAKSDIASVFDAMSPEQKDQFKAADLTADQVQDFVSKLQKSPIRELRERNAATRENRRGVMDRARRVAELEAAENRIPEMTKSLVTTSLRDADGNTYRRTLTKGVKGIRSQGDVAQQGRDARAEADLAAREEKVAAEEAKEAEEAARKGKEKNNKGR